MLYIFCYITASEIYHLLCSFKFPSLHLLKLSELIYLIIRKSRRDRINPIMCFSFTDYYKRNCSRVGKKTRIPFCEKLLGFTFGFHSTSNATESFFLCKQSIDKENTLIWIFCIFREWVTISQPNIYKCGLTIQCKNTLISIFSIICRAWKGREGNKHEICTKSQ